MTQKDELEAAIAQETEQIGEEVPGEAGGYEATEEIGEAYEPTESGGNLFSSLMRNEPNPELGDVDLSINTQQGGLSRIIRGVNKFTGGQIEPDKPPAVLDIALGIFEEIKKRGLMEESGGGGSTDGPEPSGAKGGVDVDISDYGF